MNFFLWKSVVFLSLRMISKTPEIYETELFCKRYFKQERQMYNIADDVICLSENTKDLLVKSKDNQVPTNEKEQKILGFCYYKERTLREIASLLNIEPSSYLRQEVIGSLIKNNLLYQNKNNKAITYLTNKSQVELVNKN